MDENAMDVKNQFGAPSTSPARDGPRAAGLGADGDGPALAKEVGVDSAGNLFRIAAGEARQLAAPIPGVAPARGHAVLPFESPDGRCVDSEGNWFRPQSPRQAHVAHAAPPAVASQSWPPAPAPVVPPTAPAHSPAAESPHAPVHAPLDPSGHAPHRALPPQVVPTRAPDVAPVPPPEPTPQGPSPLAVTAQLRAANATPVHAPSADALRDEAPEAVWLDARALEFVPDDWPSSDAPAAMPSAPALALGGLPNKVPLSANDAPAPGAAARMPHVPHAPANDGAAAQPTSGNSDQTGSAPSALPQAGAPVMAEGGAMRQDTPAGQGVAHVIQTLIRTGALLSADPATSAAARDLPPSPPAPVGPIALPLATVGQPYRTTITPVGGLLADYVGVTAGHLPTGLQADMGGDGCIVLAGTPQQAGVTHFTLTTTGTAWPRAGAWSRASLTVATVSQPYQLAVQADGLPVAMPPAPSRQSAQAVAHADASVAAHGAVGPASDANAWGGGAGEAGAAGAQPVPRASGTLSTHTVTVGEPQGGLGVDAQAMAKATTRLEIPDGATHITIRTVNGQVAVSWISASPAESDPPAAESAPVRRPPDSPPAPACAQGASQGQPLAPPPAKPVVPAGGDAPATAADAIGAPWAASLAPAPVATPKVHAEPDAALPSTVPTGTPLAPTAGHAGQSTPPWMAPIFAVVKAPASAETSANPVATTPAQAEAHNEAASAPQGPATGAKPVVPATVAAPVATSAPAADAPAHLPDAWVGQRYSARIKPTGGTAPYRFVISAGQLPEGLQAAMSEDGGRILITGTPTREGGQTFTITITDSLAERGGDFATSVTQACRIQVGPPVVSAPLFSSGQSESSLLGLMQRYFKKS